MKVTIKWFILAVFLITMISMYAVFTKYYLQQQEQTADVIMANIQSNTSELTYVLSRHLKKNAIETSRPLLDRYSANNVYVSAIAVFDDKKLLITTDPKISNYLTSSQIISQSCSSSYEMLHEYLASEGEVVFFEQNTMKRYQLILMLDKEHINEVFSYNRERFFLWFASLPLIMMLFSWFMIKFFIVDPLERLRQYAYYQSEIPKKAFLKEIEYIRSSMVQTFHRLEEEKRELYNLARTDALSGLANRNFLQERVSQIIADCQRNKKEFALLFLDLDHFKAVNDSLGHDVGDELLKNIAFIIQEVVRQNDVVARIGGDEFVIVLTHYKNNLELIEVINRIQNSLMRPWQIQGYPIHVTSSIGVALFPHDGNDLLTLMKCADIAMYQAKDSGRKQYSFYTEELNKKTQEYIQLTNSMQSALHDSEYVLFYQPQNCLRTGKIIGAEALVRWIDPLKGVIPPNVFIPIAEQNGFIIELGAWILETAIAQKAAWELKGISIKLSINVAAKQVLEDNFVQLLLMLLKKYSVDPSGIALEITEYIFIESNMRIHETFTTLKSIGVEISLDDFGTGYSSLSYLKAFPIDNLKIDKAFVDDFSEPDGAIFLETIIQMAQNLKLNVIAEGVETQEQVDYLKARNCDAFQGYFCSRPVDHEAFERLYEKMS